MPWTTMMVESGILGSVHELEDLEAVEAEIIDEYEEDITCNMKFKDTNEAELEIE